MKINFHNIICFVALLGLASCQEHERYFSLEGSVKGMPEQKVVLEELGFNDVKLVDSAHSDKNGTFALKGIYTEPALYRVRLGDQELLMVIDGEKIKLHSSWDNLSNYTAIGSPASNSLTGFMKHYIDASKNMLALQMAADSLAAAGAPDSLVAMVRSDLEQQAGVLKTYIKKFSDTTKSLPVALFAASRLLNDDAEIEYIKSFAAGLSKRFPDNRLSGEFREKVKEKLAVAMKSGGPMVGSVAPDFTLNSIEGKSISLRDFRGKYVLVDFWASWCPPCRAENPNVVAAYNRFKEENFTILGVSLDENADKWKEAVNKDGLIWDHVSDLQGWESAVAALYGVQSIPANFLIDPSGKIVAVNLRGDGLEKILQSKLAAATGGAAEPVARKNTSPAISKQ